MTALDAAATDDSRGRPHFSIVMPARNRELTIGRAITSVLRQTDGDFELIVVDDGSTDATASMADAVEDPRLTLLQTEPLGAASARNRGAATARGRWLTFLDSDDEADPSWLEGLRHASTEHAQVLTCGYRRMDSQQSVVVLPSSAKNPLGVEALFLAGCYAVRPSLFHAAGGFAESTPAAQHTDLALRLAPSLAGDGALVQVERPLITVHTDHEHGRIRDDPSAVLGGAEYLLDHHADVLARTPRILGDTHSVAAVSALRIGDVRRARAHLLAAVRAQPLRARSWLRLLAVMVPPLRAHVWLRPRVPGGSSARVPHSEVGGDDPAS